MNAYELNLKLAKMQFSIAKRLNFYESVMEYLEDHNTMLQAVEESAAFWNDKRDALGAMFSHWDKAMRNGSTLSKAMDGWVDPAEIAFVQASEQSLSLEPIRNLVAVIERKIESNKKMSSLLMEPAFYVLILIGGVFGIALGVVPEFRDAMPMEEASKFSQVFFAFCDWLAEYGVWVAFAFGAIYGVALASMPYWTGPGRDFANRFPPFSIYRRVNGAYFLISLSSMFRSGIGIQEAVRTFSEYASPWTKWHLRRVQRRVREGLNEGESLRTGFLPDDMQGEVSRKAVLSTFERAFERVGVRNLKRQIESLEKAALIFKYGSMFGLAGLIGCFLFAILGIVAPILAQRG